MRGLGSATAEASATRHPSLSDERFTSDEMPWDAPPASLPTDGCASAAGSPSLPTVALRVVPEGEDEVPSRVGFSTEAADRETFMELVYRDAPVLEERREELVVTHVATAGRFVRLTTEVFDDEQLVRDVPWRHPDPEEVPADGLLVRFVFIAREDRGGMDRVDRAFCLVPEGG